jgi:hypothetical protein
MAQRPKRRRKRGGEAPRRKGGVMMGMRRGFKKAATSVVGAGEAQKAPSRGRSILSTAFTVLLVVAALAFLFYRWR